MSRIYTFQKLLRQICALRQWSQLAPRLVRQYATLKLGQIGCYLYLKVESFADRLPLRKVPIVICLF